MQSCEVDAVLAAASVVVLAGSAPGICLELVSDRIQDLTRIALVPRLISKPMHGAVALPPEIRRARVPTDVAQRLDGRTERPGHAVPRWRGSKGTAGHRPRPLKSLA